MFKVFNFCLKYLSNLSLTESALDRRLSFIMITNTEVLVTYQTILGIKCQTSTHNYSVKTLSDFLTRVKAFWLKIVKVFWLKIVKVCLLKIVKVCPNSNIWVSSIQPITEKIKKCILCTFLLRVSIPTIFSLGCACTFNEVALDALSRLFLCTEYRLICTVRCSILHTAQG